MPSTSNYIVMAKAKGIVQKDHVAIGTILGQIIDEWYQRVEPHYLTTGDAELKFFHDTMGHRIKFNKDGLDFTYGLKCYGREGVEQSGNSDCIIEISVNNKVQGFDYQDFQAALLAHYTTMKGNSITSPAILKTCSYQDVFALEPNLDEAFRVEKYEGKADVMCLSFRINAPFVKKVATPVAGKQLIEDYCVAPFRSIYATVYRRQSNLFFSSQQHG